MRIPFAALGIGLSLAAHAQFIHLDVHRSASNSLTAQRDSEPKVATATSAPSAGGLFDEEPPPRVEDRNVAKAMSGPPQEFLTGGCVVVLAAVGAGGALFLSARLGRQTRSAANFPLSVTMGKPAPGCTDPPQ